MPRPVSGLVERPRLFALLDRGALGRVTVLSAPAGSGKTMLLASWLRRADLPGPVAWVGVERDERDDARFWHAVLDELRRSGAFAAGDPLAALAPAPMGGEQDELLQRLLDGLGRLARPVLLVLDDIHHLRSDAGIAGVEQLIARAPAQLRVIVAGRHDPKLGLHRLRLAGDLVEIRAADLEFTAEEAGELMAGAGVSAGGDDVARLRERTEGWAAGLRLAAMSLAGHGDPERFVAEFSGSERTVADYLLAEVLASRPPEVRHLLLRTCILERISGPLADLLTGRGDGTRVLGELEESNAFVVALDVGRTWFRYHHLFGDLLRLELRREAAEEIPELHRRAARWFAGHNLPVDAIRHATLGQDWELAVELLGRHWVHLVLEGEEATLETLLAGLPGDMPQRDGEVAAIAAADRLARSRWEEADTLLATAERAHASVPAARRRRAGTALATVQILRARRLGGLDAVVDAGQALLGRDGDGGEPAGEELQALALMNLGIAEGWTLRLEESGAHLERGLELARRARSPYVEVGCLGALGMRANLILGLEPAETLLREAVTLAERSGWSTHPITGPIYVTLGYVRMERGALAECESWLERAGPILERAPEPPATVGLHHTRAMLALAQGRVADAIEGFEAALELAVRLQPPHFVAPLAHHWRLRAKLRLGDDAPARAALAERGDTAEWCSLQALVQLADGDAQAAADAVAPVVDGTAFAFHVNREIEGLLIDGIARRQLGDGAAAERSTERALALAEPQGRMWIFMAVPGAHELLAAHPVHRTAHAGLLRRLLAPRRPSRCSRRAPRPAQRTRALGPAVPAHQPVGVGDRRRAVPLGSHRQDPHAQAVREARRAHAGGCRCSAAGSSVCSRPGAAFTRIV